MASQYSKKVQSFADKVAGELEKSFVLANSLEEEFYTEAWHY